MHLVQTFPRALLRTTDRGIAGIAFDCGFGSAGSFTTLFKRTFGVTPGAIRKNEEAPRPASR